jgi:PAS domain S-box-containing protein
VEIIFPPALVESLLALVEWTSGGEPSPSVEIPIQHRDGTTRTVLWNSAMLLAPDGQTPVATIAQGQDITGRVAVEERLRLLTRALEAAANGVTITDDAGTILWVNAAFTTLTGYSAAEAVGQNPRILKSGQQAPAYYRDMQETILAGRVWHGTLTNRRKDGSLYRQEMTITPVRQGTGPITHFIAIKQDITARQQAEEERHLMEVQLRHAQKLESIGQLAAGIAHEINTPTQYIGDNTRFLQDAFKDIAQVLGHYDRLLQAARQQQVTPELVAATTDAVEAADVAYLAQEVPKAIAQTLQGVARVTKIVRAMKDFSHPGSAEKTPLDLNQAIESTTTVAHNEWKYVADLDLALDPQLPLVPCLPGEINQVILNLVINAAHAIGDVVGDGAGGKGRISVSTRLAGEWAEIRVQDTGTGIPESARARIFEPFFTTKAVGKGTGQGLSIAHLVVVKQHGGTIEFETELGQGTTFIVRLPLHPGLAAPARNL